MTKRSSEAFDVWMADGFGLVRKPSQLSTKTDMVNKISSCSIVYLLLVFVGASLADLEVRTGTSLTLELKMRGSDQ